MAKNMWQKERSGMLRDLIREYIEEGYEHRDAKKERRSTQSSNRG